MKRLLTMCALAVAASPGGARAEGDAPADEVRALREELEAQRARLEELEATDENQVVKEQKEPPLRLYGFMDVGVQKVFAEATSLGSLVTQSNAATFVLGNVNVYIDAQPVEGWRGLVEVRFTNAPHGAENPGLPGTPYSRVDNDVFDSTSANGGWSQLRWGAIVIERAHLDWHQSDHLNVRAGVFLTPAGIWNVDHGTPTLIALQEPGFLALEMFPPRQTGLQIFGAHHFAPWSLEYTLYVSNGRVAQQLDPTDNKAFGGRVVLRSSARHRLALGASFYANHFEDRERTIVSFEGQGVRTTTTISSDEACGGVDASIDLGPLRLRAEGALRHVTYEEGKRSTLYGIPGLYLSDRNELDAYVLAAYQLPWLGLEPYLNVEVQRTPTPLGEGQLVPSAGFNLRFTAATTLKVQVSHAFFWGDWAESANNFTVAAARAVLAF